MSGVETCVWLRRGNRYELLYEFPYRVLPVMLTYFFSINLYIDFGEIEIIQNDDGVVSKSEPDCSTFLEERKDWLCQNKSLLCFVDEKKNILKSPMYNIHISFSKCVMPFIFLESLFGMSGNWFRRGWRYSLSSEICTQHFAFDFVVFLYDHKLQKCYWRYRRKNISHKTMIWRCGGTLEIDTKCFEEREPLNQFPTLENIVVEQIVFCHALCDALKTLPDPIIQKIKLVMSLSSRWTVKKSNSLSQL